ncbi:hypothetical protein BH18ACT13_BH18ACT13_19160 [soil metagenome]
MLTESETPALQAYLAHAEPVLTSSTLSIVEVLRACRVADPRDGARRGRALLERVTLLDLDRELLDESVTYTSAQVRSLDAIHLATATRIDARQMLVYDLRLA